MISIEKASYPKQVRRVTRPFPLKAGDPRYVGLDDVRGDKVRQKLSRLLYIDPEDMERQPAHISYAGHRGNGKTTELFAFMDDMKDEFFFIYLNRWHTFCFHGDWFAKRPAK